MITFECEQRFFQQHFFCKIFHRILLLFEVLIGLQWSHGDPPMAPSPAPVKVDQEKDRQTEREIIGELYLPSGIIPTGRRDL